ncbi:MAG TPA: hypothetical protein VGL80_22540 [Pseudonocardiaceae bacterium]
MVSSVVAPVAMIGGWVLAASLQPPGYSAVRDTISALAAEGARWVEYCWQWAAWPPSW